MLIANDQLKKILVDSNIIAEKEWNAALHNAERRRRDIGDILIERGLINAQYLYESIADFLKVPFVDLKRVVVELKALAVLSEESLLEYHAIPFKLDKKTLHVALLDPTDKKTISAIERQTKTKVTAYLTTHKSFTHALRLHQKSLADEIQEMIEQAKTDNYPTNTIVDTILSYAIISGASDVHVEPLSDALLIRFRIDGALHDVDHAGKF